MGCFFVSYLLTVRTSRPHRGAPEAQPRAALTGLLYLHGKLTALTLTQDSSLHIICDSLSCDDLSYQEGDYAHQYLFSIA